MIPSCNRIALATTADDTLPPFTLPAVARKKVIAVFDGGRPSSDGGVPLSRGIEHQLGLAERLAGDMVDFQHNHAQQLESFAVELGPHKRNACRIEQWVRLILCNIHADWIGAELRGDGDCATTL